MGESLPTRFQELKGGGGKNRFYVYLHADPETKELLYVGKGSGQRAWMCTGGYAEAHYGNRSREHFLRLSQLMDKGYLPCDWVVVLAKGLTSEEALKMEQEFIRTRKPMFNKAIGKKLCKLDVGQLSIMKDLRAQGLSYLSIAKEFRVSTITVYRAINGQTKNLMEVSHV